MFQTFVDDSMVGNTLQTFVQMYNCDMFGIQRFVTTPAKCYNEYTLVYYIYYTRYFIHLHML